MAYGIKYYGEFDSFKDDACMYFVVQILEKDYTGDPTAILLSGVPAVQEWQDDERNKPIKGSTLKVGIINNGIVSLESFYSNYDDQYMVTLRQRSTDAVLFTGFIIQDECSEILTDFAHEINLTATDMLGTLKDITLGQAAEQYGDLTTFSNIFLSAYNSNTLQTTDLTVSSLKIGQKINISNGIFEGDYTVFDIVKIGLVNYRITLSFANFTPSTSDTCDMTWRIPTDLTTYISLGEIVRLCLQSTKLELPTKVIATIYDKDGDTLRWMDSTCLMGNTFMDNGQWMSCYDVLENIFGRFRATLFQSKGFWWIVRYNELFIGNIAPSPGNYLYGYQYDSEMDYLSDINTNSTFLLFNYNNMEFGTTKSIERPVGYIKDTFNYKQPESLLNNPNLEELGDLINQYTTGSGSSLQNIYEYELPYWQLNPLNTINPNRFIRIIKDVDFVEVERYIVLTGPATQTYPYAALESNDIYISIGDRVSFDVDFKTKTPINGHYYIMGAVKLTDGINTYYLDNNNIWQTTVSYANLPQVYILHTDNTGEWHTYSIKANASPINGYLNLYLFTPTYYAPTFDEIYFKNIDFQIKNYISGQGNVVGHVHTYNNLIDLNNIIENEIAIDTSPSPTISGTLFLDNYTGILRNRSNNWAYPGGIYGGYMVLGKKILLEDLFIKYKARYKYEGNLLNVYVPFPGDYIIGPETVFIYGGNPSDTIRLIFGKLSIDYKQGMADCNMFYISDKDEDIQDIIDGYVYEFNYLYENN